MKRLDVWLALLVLLAIAVGVHRGRSVAPDASLFGEEMALAPELEPLVLPGGDLELRGQVLTLQGEPAVEALVTLFPVRETNDAAEENAPIHPAYTDSDGRFALRGLAPGAYRAVLIHPSAPPRAVTLELPMTDEARWMLAAPLPPLASLPPLRFTRLRGRLAAPPSTDAAESGPGALEGFEVVLAPADGTPLLAAAAERRVTTVADGRFAVEELVVAPYRVEVLPPWARGGSWPVIGRGTVEAREDAPATLDLTLEVGALEGELREADGRPLNGALVSVSSLDQRDPVGAPRLWPPSVSDAAGHFAVELLPPGRYQVHLRAGLAAHDREVVVEGGRRTRLEPLQLDPRASAAGVGG